MNDDYPVRVDEEPTVVVRLTPRRARLLAALADYPDWDAQPPEAGEFYQELFEALDEAGYGMAAGDADLVAKTTVDEG